MKEGMLATMKHIPKAILAIMVLGAFVGTCVVRRKRSVEASLPIIETTTVERGDVSVTVSGSGTVKPLTTVDVKSEAPGKVVELMVGLGDVVKKGQVIAMIDPADSRTTYTQAQADVEGARAAVDQAQAAFRLQQKLTPAQIRQARQQLELAKARLRQAEKQAEAQPELTRTAIAQAQATYDSAVAALRQAQDATHPQTRERAEADLATGEASLKTQQAALDQLRSATHPQGGAAAQAAYDQAKASRDNAEKNLKRMKDLHAKGFVSQSEVDSAEEEHEVAKARTDSAKLKLDTLRQEQEEELKAAQARVAEAKATLASARRRLDTLTPELSGELRNAEAKVAQAKAALESAQANRIQDQLKQEDLKAAKAEAKQTEAALDQALADTLQEEVKQRDIARNRSQSLRAFAQLTNAAKQLRETTIVAPRNGIVLQKFVEEGTMVVSGSRGLSTGTAGNIVQLGDMSRVFVDCEVDETDIGKVWMGQGVDITIDAFPEQTFDGKVTRIDPQTTVEQNVTYVHVEVEIDMPDPRLKPGMSANCDFVVERKKDVVVVPPEALREGEEGNTVNMLMDKEPRPLTPAIREVPMKIGKRLVTKWMVPRKVEAGQEGNEAVEIKSGLKEGEIIVTSFVEPQKVQAPAPGVMTGPPRR
jgi:HlyD family secretion protein